MKRAAVLLALGVIALASCAAQPPAQPVDDADALSGTVTIFAAASLVETFDAMAEAFEAEHPDVDVVLNYGGSSGLAEQIVQGAPADVFAAASTSTMTTVTDADLAAGPAVFTSNTLEIAVPAGNPGGVEGIADFARPELAIALCAAEVPCGAVAATVLDLAGITAAVDTYEQDVKAVLTKVGLGEVDAGLVYRTDVLAAGDAVEGIPFDEAADAITDYPIAVLTDAPNPDAAAAFLEYVLSAEGQQTLTDAGFVAP